MELNTIENTKFDLQVFACDKKIASKIIRISTDGRNIRCKDLSLFYDVISNIIPHLTYYPENKKEIAVDKIKQCIHRNPYCSLSEIALMCNISQPYLYSLFKEVTHITPNNYRQKVLCEIGVKLLTTTDKKIEEIAGMLSLSSGSYFRKLIKKHTGFIPREIKRTSSEKCL